MDRVGTLIVGAGVVGLAIARALARTGREVVIVEQQSRFGTGISARSSEVIHAGLYYPPDSLKATTCVLGARLLVRYCRERQIPWRPVGKLIVANGPRQIAVLHEILANARRCGVHSLASLDRASLRDLEPELRADAAILSPTTGIVDSHALMTSLLADAEHAGAVLALDSDAREVHISSPGFVVQLSSGGAEVTVHADELINAAGLGALALARRVSGTDHHDLPQLRLAKGSWFAAAGRVPFSHLIYPVPEPGGLGIHLTLDLAGRARFGPDVEWVDSPDYRIDPLRAARFEESVRQYWPGVSSLAPADAGIRPKLSGPGEPAADFRLDGPARHGIRGLVHLFGIESPGLTASLAIAELVRRELGYR